MISQESLIWLAGGALGMLTIVLGLQAYARKWFLRGVNSSKGSETEEKPIPDVVVSEQDNLITEEYDLVLGHEVVHFLQTLSLHGLMLNYADFLADVREAIELKKANFPTGTNTVILRRVIISEDRTATYVLEGVSNPNTKSVLT